MQGLITPYSSPQLNVLTKLITEIQLHMVVQQSIDHGCGVCSLLLGQYLSLNKRASILPYSFHKPCPPRQPMKKSYIILENGEQWIPEQKVKNVF